MSSKLEIINNGLMKVGLPLAASLQDADYNASIIFDKVAKEALRSFAWGFATVYAKLSASSSAPAHGFSHSYSMPSDCLRVLDVRMADDLRAPKARFSISGRLIYANVTPCHVRYIKNMASSPDDWPEDFGDAVSCKIAAEICCLSAQTATMVPGLLQMYQISLAQAQAIDSTETNERVPLDESILATREGR